MLRCRHKVFTRAYVVVSDPHTWSAEARWCQSCGAFKVEGRRWRRPSDAAREQRAKPNRRQLLIEGVI
jgi:hypothetical protein